MDIEGQLEVQLVVIVLLKYANAGEAKYVRVVPLSMIVYPVLRSDTDAPIDLVPTFTSCNSTL